MGNRQAARIGQIAEIAAWAGNHVGEQADIARSKARFFRSAPKLGQCIAAHPRQEQILIMRDAQLTSREKICQSSGCIQLLGCHIAGRLTHALAR